jgi:hypothetical protein
LFGLALILVALSYLGGVAAQDRVPRGDDARWLAFDGQAAAAQPSLTVLQAGTEAIDLAADLPGVWVEDVTVDAGAFSRLGGEGYGFPAAIGLPEMPVVRRQVEVPFGAGVRLEVVAAEYDDYALEALGLQPIYPLQPPLPKVPGARESQPFEIDARFYAGDGGRGFYPTVPAALGEVAVVRGHRLQPVEVWPVAYDPAEGRVRLYRRLVLRLHLAGGDPVRTGALARRYASPAFEARLADQVLNYNQGRPVVEFGPETPAGYLIVTADAYYDAMQPFVALQSARGLQVTITRLSDIPGGSSNSAIKAYVQEAYDNWPLPPSYLLLVGDTDTVPGWGSVSAGEITDLYYVTMDGSTDWHPDLGRGRFPVRSAAQATDMVEKYLAYAALTGQEDWLAWASFIATCDLYQVAEGTHNYVVDNYTLPQGYSGIFPNDPQAGGDKLYCITYNATRADVHASVDQGRWIVIYSGHGSHTGWEFYGASDVATLTNAGMYPFVASHACITGDFEETQVYGETWVLQPNAGALAFWGSSDSSYWDEDDILEKAAFDRFLGDTDHPADVTEMTYYGLAETEAAYPGMARYYWETYNLLGDPSVKVFLEPENPFSLSVEPAELQVCAGGRVTATASVSTTAGYAPTVSLLTGPLPAGLAASFEPPAALPPFESELALDAAAGTPAGNHSLVVTATDGLTWSMGALLDLEVIAGLPDTVEPIAPPNDAVDQLLRPQFVWTGAAGAAHYRLQVARDPLFSQPVLDVTGLSGPAYLPEAPLAEGRCHWWRVQAGNLCGQGAWSQPARFCTVDLAPTFEDDVESGAGLWSHGATSGTDHWAITTDQAHSPGHAWHVPDDPVKTDSALWPSAPFPVVDGTVLSFWHRFQFEGLSYDGAVLEISVDGGAWTDLGAQMTANGYNGTLSGGTGNPLGGRAAWVGDQTAWTRVEADLSPFAGHEARVRWRLGCDMAAGDAGWFIDDVLVTSPLPMGPPPVMLEVVPDLGLVAGDTAIEIHGLGFLDTPAAHLGDTWLLSVTPASSTTLHAVVPGGMATGTYTLTLVNGDCQEAVLPAAYRAMARLPFVVYLPLVVKGP